MVLPFNHPPSFGGDGGGRPEKTTGTALATSDFFGERSALSTLTSLYERKARSMYESAAREHRRHNNSATKYHFFLHTQIF